MAQGYKARGGANPLNFKVVNGTTEPTNPKENTVWVNMASAITGWYFGSDEPDVREEGTLWITTGVSSNAAFNALKKNGLKVYPISAKHYRSGAWVEKPAKIYQGGEWVEWWGGWLYRNGDEYVDVTGGWEFKTNCNGSFTKNEDSMYLHTFGKTGTFGYAVVHTEKPIDLTKFTKLVAKTTDWRNTGGEILPRIGVNTSVPVSYQQLKDDLVAYIDSGTELDISNLSGEYYVFFGCAIGGNTSLNHYITVNEIQLK